MLDAFEAIKAVGGVAQVHAESGDVVEREERAMIQRGITGRRMGMLGWIWNY